MKTKASYRVLAAVMALVMVLLMAPHQTIADVNAVANTYTLEASGLEAFAAGTKTDGQTETTADGFFNLHWSAKSKVDDSTKEFSDGYTSSQRINFGGGATTGEGAKNAISFTLRQGSTASVKVWWAAGGDSRQVSVLNADGSTYARSNAANVTSGTAYVSTLPIKESGTYYIGGYDTANSKAANNYIFKVEVTVTTEDSGTDPQPTTGSAGQTTTYTFDPSAQVTLGADKDPIAVGTEYADYFAVSGTVTQRVKSGAVYCVEVAKNGNGAMTFTVTGTADVTVIASSTGSSNASAVALVDASGNVIANNEGITEVSTTATTSMTYTGLTAGTYQVVSPDSEYNRGARIHGITVEQTASGSTPEPTTTPAPTTTAPEPTQPGGSQTDPDKIDVWDFGFEMLDETKYNNLLTVEKANANFYVSGNVAEEGTVNGGNTIGSFSLDNGDFVFDGGGKVNHRLRVNTAIEGLTCHSTGKYLTDDNGVTYNGFLYSNAGGSSAVRIRVKAQAGDILTFVHGSNGGDADIQFISPSGRVTTDKFTCVAGNSAHGEVSAFYCDVDGVYTFCYTTEKLVVARVTRQHTKEVAVSGDVTAPAELTDYSLVFTCNESGAVVEAPVSGGSYSTTLREGYSYALSLKNANGYVIESGDSLIIPVSAGGIDHDVKVIPVELFTLSGNIVGLSEDALAKLKLSFVADRIYIPEPVIEGTAYVVKLEKGVTYDVVEEGINDYVLTGSAQINLTEDTVRDLEFEAKPTYKVTIAPEGCTLADLAGATFTFTNLNEEGYVYTFTGTDAIALRDGVYSVKVSNSGVYVQKLTSNLKVEGADVTKTIGFDGDVSVWDFSASDFTGTSPYNGLSFDNGQKNKTYLLAKGGTITVPVKGDCLVKVTACYEYSFYFVSDTEASVGVKTGSTSQMDVFEYAYTGDAGTVDITVLGTSYICKIEVVEVAPYKETITVGASGCDYTTINDALDAVRAMTRTDDQRVTISIQPGNYEEMLVIDVPNVTLKNASDTPSIELTNKGVDIDANAVRITHYYGHGYDYYSMNADCKWDEEVLKVSKENGYPSYTNPGTGTTRGSYWNATVTVKADGFRAEGIIFENSFNQYVSQKAADDVIVPNSGAKEGSVPRADLPAGSTAVQDKKYVERAAALAIANDCQEIFFDNCKFVGRQDTLYGGTGVTAAFYDCSIYGACDYIFGGMTAVFAKCDLVFNTSEDGDDVGYITAAQTAAGSHGMLMYNCRVTSTTPGVDTASEYTSKPGYFGRPWAADTGEAVFYKTVIDASDSHWYDISPSLIRADGWLSTLSGQSVLCGEYGTYEYALDVDNSANRVSWAAVFAEEKLASGEAIAVETFLGTWDAFAGKDMTITMPTEKVDNKPEEDDPVVPGETVTYVLDATADMTAFAQGTKQDGDTETVKDFFTIIYSAKNKVDGSNKTFDDGYTATQRLNFGGKTEPAKNMINSVMFKTTGPATVKIWWVSGGDGRTMAIYDAGCNVIDATAAADSVKNSLYISEFTLDAAGTYYLGVPEGSNYLFKLQVTEDAPVASEEFVLDTTEDLTAFAQGTKQDGDTETVKDFFTIIYSAKNKVDGSNKTFDDGYTATQRLNFGGKTEPAKNMINSVMFKTTGPATVKIWWVSGGDGRTMAIYDAGCNVIDATAAADSVKNSLYISEFTLDAAGTYYLGVPEGSNYLFKLQVTVGGSTEVPRGDWDKVAPPVISGATTEDGKVSVTVDALVGNDGGDEVIVTMYDAEGNEIATKRSIAENGQHTLVFEPTASGKYTFKATLKRDGEEDKTSATDFNYDYVLPLEAPIIASVTSKGAGSMEVIWGAVEEAVSYNIYVDGTRVGNTAELKYTATGLTVGTKYSFTVEAVRGEDKAMSEAMSATATEKEQRVWSTTIYGPSTNTSSNGVVGSINEDGYVTVYSEGGRGKLQYKDSDGLTYYYTAIPEDKNFTFRVRVQVDSWKYSNGQEGFGIMATDRVAPNGTATWWSNQYMAMLSKVEYRYDHSTGSIFHTNTTDGVKYNLRLGVGTTAKLGITPENLPLIEKNDTNTILQVADGVTYPLDISVAKNNPAGNYNCVGNNTNPDALTAAGLETISEKTEFILEIQRNNTGYFITYYDQNGKIIGQQKNYDPKALSHLDTENVYVGFFAARNARATFTIEELSVIDPADDAPAEEKPITYVTPSLSFVSSDISTSGQYTLSLSSNVSGTLHIKLNDQILAEAAVIQGNVRFDLPIELTKKGNNRFYITFTPDPNQDLGEDTELANADEIFLYKKIQYNTKFADKDVIWVSKWGDPDGTGTKSWPVDIATALKNVKAGQTIILKEGTYKLDSGLVIQRGISGTADQPIRMIPDPDAETRPVLDFRGTGAGLQIVGDYWYINGIDVTNSVNGKPGIHVCGSYNTLDGVNAYHNGNTGIQISRFKGSDLRSEWPSNNLILNCTSFGNADAGYEDADGFAAKLTCGDGNVFDGCVAHHNADDGWDLYAKVETGSIGVVTIRNCVAYANGYLEDGTDAGNGNGFKLGGSNMPGAHKLINSYAFFNKAKGIDSNSGPDVIVENCTTFNNESYNVAFYTNINQNTNYRANGILSLKDSTVKSGYDKADNLKPRGNQDNALFLNDSNYYWYGDASKNAAGAEITTDIFLSTEFKGVKRNSDGTIDLQGFLQLKEDAGITGGAKPDGTPSEIPPLPETPVEPTDPSQPGDPENPETGDLRNPALWAVVMLVTALGLVVIPYCRKRGF